MKTAPTSAINGSGRIRQWRASQPRQRPLTYVN